MARKPTARELRALDDAQEVVHAAWDAAGARRRALAERAPALSPLCSDAHVILAMGAPAGSEAALGHWRAGVAAGEAAIGPAGFREMAGMFWGFLETRPYMRARHGLAHALWEAGEKAEAIGHLDAMLRLNPNDNQGVRYELAGWLLTEGRDEAAATLLDTYPEEGMAVWPWATTLLAFRRGGAEGARAPLAGAMEANPHVAPLLAGAKRMPKRSPAFYGWGDANEAVVVAEALGAAWEATPGAVAWLRSALPPARAPRRPKTAG